MLVHVHAQIQIQELNSDAKEVEDPSHAGHVPRCVTLGASHWVHHTRCITPDASHQMHHTRCITLYTSQCVTHDASLGVSHWVHHRGCITLGASQVVCHWVHHTGYIALVVALHRASVPVHVGHNDDSTKNFWTQRVTPVM